MPITPLHYPIAYFLYKLDKRLSLPELIGGCVFPDLEIPIIILLFGSQIPHRLVFQSLIGSATIGTFLAIMITIQVYPYLVSYLFKVDKEEIKRKCKLSFTLTLSVFVGIISHVLLDVTNHPYNPIFWPFLETKATPSPLYFALGEPLGSLWMHGIMGVLLAIVIIMEQKNAFSSAASWLESCVKK